MSRKKSTKSKKPKNDNDVLTFAASRSDYDKVSRTLRFQLNQHQYQQRVHVFAEAGTRSIGVDLNIDEMHQLRDWLTRAIELCLHSKGYGEGREAGHAEGRKEYSDEVKRLVTR